jgi:predicted PurR-regulated permease PerM
VTADTRATVRTTLTVIGLVLITALAMLLVYETRRVLMWIVIAAFFATALYPAVNWLERRVSWCPRWLATLIVFLVVLLAAVGLIAAFVAPLVREGARLASELPDIVAQVRQGQGRIGGLVERLHLRQYADAERLRGYLNNVTGQTLAILRSAFTTIAGLITIFVLAYLMVLEAPKLIDGFLALFPDRRAERIRRVGADCARSVTGYLTGNILISIICGTLTYIVLLVLHVPYAALVALFVAFADLLPLVGATLGATVATLVALSRSVTAAVVVVVFFIVYQQVENHLLQPVVMSRTVSLNPLTVLVAVLIAAELGGFVGALLAIPIAGIIQVIVRNVWDERRGRLRPEPTVGTDKKPVSEVEPEPPESESDVDGDRPRAGVGGASAGSVPTKRPDRP